MLKNKEELSHYYFFKNVINNSKQVYFIQLKENIFLMPNKGIQKDVIRNSSSPSENWLINFKTFEDLD